ncbi:hypothetical protein ACIBCA_01990 [Kitasatospora sp. NPDC051170]|uniref:hypothetical protein n=1 Tax=Kitasatospora sp. NPDC051170 TaxID=3364056 RepID=UPI0037B0DF12
MTTPLKLGITVAEHDLTLVHTLHHLDADDGRSRLQLFFRAARHQGRLQTAEPHKCEELRRWPLDRLPHDTVPYTAQVKPGSACATARVTSSESVSRSGRPGHRLPPISSSIIT